MGLDIRAYSHLTYVGHCPDRDEEDHGYDPDTYARLHVEAYAYDSFPHALMGVPNVRTQTLGGSVEFLTGGCYALTDKTETHAFRAGSYSGYNAWRRDLAARFNPTSSDGRPNPEGPFYELIWFADNEGTIAELPSIKLLGDFRTHEAEYRAAHAGAEHGDYYVEKYADWLRAFELAADGGLVDFH